MQDADASVLAELRGLVCAELLMAHVAALHREFRGYCDMMGVGLALPRGDSVVEEKAKEGGGWLCWGCGVLHIL
jgi:hypothetical protein